MEKMARPGEEVRTGCCNLSRDGMLFWRGAFLRPRSYEVSMGPGFAIRKEVDADNAI